MKTIRFYSRADILNKEYPYFLLEKDNWNDYWAYETLFDMSYHTVDTRTQIGSMKILDKREGNGHTKLPDEFLELDENFCSIGTDLQYYKNLKTCLEDFETLVLDRLNDVAFFSTIAEDFETHPGFKTSLLRFSETEKAYKQAKKYFAGVDYKEGFKFQYTCRIEHAEADHCVNFNFSDKSQLPSRIIALIGRNGTGKTQFLSNLALDISGESKENIGNFTPYRPLFSKIIAVSYSVFDEFTRPNKSKTFSYKYCGLRDSKGIISRDTLDGSYAEAINQIEKFQRSSIWYNVLSKIIPRAILNEYRDKFFTNKDFTGITAKGKQSLSSGQSILMFIFTEIIANIREESLILFDEPETHLHPNAIANVVNSLHMLLEDFDSYAILATHSPIIVQEIYSDNVYVFERQGNIPIVRVLDIESFGENISTITKHVFETVEVKENFKKHFEVLADSHTYEQVLSLFKDRLSFNAKMYLKNLYNKKQNEES